MNHLSEVEEGLLVSGSGWRSMGGLAAGLVARAERKRSEEAEQARRSFIPVAWAAE